MGMQQLRNQIRQLDFEIHAAMRIFTNTAVADPQHLTAFMNACETRERLMRAFIEQITSVQAKQKAEHRATSIGLAKNVAELTRA